MKYLKYFSFLLISLFGCLLFNNNVYALEENFTDNFTDTILFNTEVSLPVQTNSKIFSINGKNIEFKITSKNYLSEYEYITFDNKIFLIRKGYSYSIYYFDNFTYNDVVFDGYYLTLYQTNNSINDFFAISSEEYKKDGLEYTYFDLAKSHFIYIPSINNYLYPVSIENLDDIHTTHILYDNLGNLYKEADINFNTLGTVVTPVEDLDYNNILDVFSDKLKESTIYDYNDFYSHLIFQDVNTSNLTDGTYHIVFYNDESDLVFADVPEKNDGRAHSIGAPLYYTSNGKNSGLMEVCYASFNSLADLENLNSITCETMTSIESNGDYFEPLWSDTKLRLFYKNWKKEWVYKDNFYSTISAYSVYDYKLILKPGESVLLKPKVTTSTIARFDYNNVFDASWVSYSDGAYSILTDTSFAVLNFTNLYDISNYRERQQVLIKQSYIDNGYYLAVSNRNTDVNLNLYMFEKYFDYFLFTTSTTNLNDGDIVLNNPTTILRDSLNTLYGSFESNNYSSISKEESNSSNNTGSNNSNTGVIDSFFDITNTIESAKSFFGAFSVIGSMVTVFMETMPPLFVNGLYALFSLGIVVLLIKLFL